MAQTVKNAGDPGLFPGSGRSPGEGNGNPLQYCLENSTDRGAWRATVHGAAKSQTQMRDYTFSSSGSQTAKVFISKRHSQRIFVFQKKEIHSRCIPEKRKLIPEDVRVKNEE